MRSLPQLRCGDVVRCGPRPARKSPLRRTGRALCDCGGEAAPVSGTVLLCRRSATSRSLQDPDATRLTVRCLKAALTVLRHHQVRRSGASGAAVASPVSRVIKAAQSSAATPVASGAEILRMMAKVMTITIGDRAQRNHAGNVTAMRCWAVAARGLETILEALRAKKSPARRCRRGLDADRQALRRRD
jgi:hypothetical protein